MNTNKILIAGLFGGVASFILGFLIYGLLLTKFFEANMVGGVTKGNDELVLWAIAVGNLCWGLLIALIYGRWAGIKTLTTGAKTGFIIGLLAYLSFNITMFGAMNVHNLTSALVDSVVGGVITAVVGGVVGWWLGKGEKA